MALAISFDDAKANQLRHEGNKNGVIGGTTVTPFFGSRHTRKHPSSGAVSHNRNGVEIPDATLAQFDPGKISRPHFHLSDQFQVIMAGKGTLGRHELAPYTVHFSRAYTPYGPLVADVHSGMTLFILRAHRDPGSQRLPQERAQLLEARDRKPWQITRVFTFPTLAPDARGDGVELLPIPDMRDEHGLAAYTLRMKPNTRTLAPDPLPGDGQYLVVVKGSLWHNDKQHQALTLVFVRPDEGQFPIHAGIDGLEALVLNYPVPHARAANRSVRPATRSATWQCSLCSFVYDAAAGLPGEGIVPGTRWEDLPATWNCPDCSASRDDFYMVNLGTRDGN